jgi:hypothetical protein
MSELETRLRELFDEVAPADSRTDGLVEGAREEATRMRRRRAATVAAVLVLVLVVAGAVASWDFRDRALVPANHVTHLTCALATRNLSAEPASNARPTSAMVREVLACPNNNGSPSPLGLPESEPVSAAVDLDYLRFEPPTAGAACPNLPAGHTYRMLFLREDGQPRVLDNTALACNGWPALDRYAVALGDQQSTEQAAKLSDPFPKCPSILGQHVNPASGQAPALPRGTRIAAASSCLHPLSYPDTLPVVVPVKRRALSTAELAVLNAALARAGSTKQQAESCPGPRVGAEGVVHAVTSTGVDVTLTHLCLDSYQMVVNWNKDDIVTFTQKTFDALGGS